MSAEIIRLDDHRKPAPTRAWSPYERVYFLNLSLWHAQCRLAAEYAAQVFGYDDTRDGPPSDSPTDVA